jgi:hypothetical protein
MEDLCGVTGTFRWEIVGKTGVSAEAESLHQQGRQAGAARDYNKALGLLGRASVLAPRWPYPVYDTAYTPNVTVCKPSRASLDPLSSSSYS